MDVVNIVINEFSKSNHNCPATILKKKVIFTDMVFLNALNGNEVDTLGTPATGTRLMNNSGRCCTRWEEVVLHPDRQFKKTKVWPSNLEQKQVSEAAAVLNVIEPLNNAELQKGVTKLAEQINAQKKLGQLWSNAVSIVDTGWERRRGTWRPPKVKLGSGDEEGDSDSDSGGSDSDKEQLMWQ